MSPLYELNRRTDLHNRWNMLSTAPVLQSNFLDSYYDVSSFAGYSTSGAHEKCGIHGADNDPLSTRTSFERATKNTSGLKSGEAYAS